MVEADFVLDCSLTMSWCFPEEGNRMAARLLEAMSECTAVVTPLWYLEVANALLAAERRKRITLQQALEFTGLLDSLAVKIDNQLAARAFNRISELARDHGLSAYDASYLELAWRVSLPLATLDDALAAASRKLKLPPLEI